MGAEIFRKVRQRAHHRIGGEPAERAKRAELHGVAEIGDQRDLPVGLDIGGEPVERLMLPNQPHLTTSTFVKLRVEKPK